MTATSHVVTAATASATTARARPPGNLGAPCQASAECLAGYCDKGSCGFKSGLNTAMFCGK